MMLWLSVIVLLLSAALGYKVVSRVPPLLHTPLMSGMNALSGVTVLGALAVLAAGGTRASGIGASVAVVLAMVNVAGGFWVTERMLRLFKQEKKGGEVKDS